MKKILVVLIMLCIVFSAFATTDTPTEVTSSSSKTINLSASIAAGSGVGGGDSESGVDTVDPVVDPSGDGLGIWLYYDVAGAGTVGDTTLSSLTGVSTSVTVTDFDLTGVAEGSDNIYIYLVAASNVSTAADTTISLSSENGWKYDGTPADKDATTSIPLTFTDNSYQGTGNLTASAENLSFNSGTTGTGIKVSAVANSSVLNKTIVSKTKVGWAQSTGYLSGDWAATITVAVSGS